MMTVHTQKKKNTYKRAQHARCTKIFSPKCIKRMDISVKSTVLYIAIDHYQSRHFLKLSRTYTHCCTEWKALCGHFTKHTSLYKVNTHAFRVDLFDDLNTHKTVMPTAQASTTAKANMSTKGYHAKFYSESVHSPFREARKKSKFHIRAYQLMHKIIHLTKQDNVMFTLFF